MKRTLSSSIYTEDNAIQCYLSGTQPILPSLLPWSSGRKKQHVTKEEFPRTETVQELMQGTHTCCRDQFGVERNWIHPPTTRNLGQSTALCPGATTSRKFPVQTAASTRYLSFLPPTGALQPVSIFWSFACCWLWQDLWELVILSSKSFLYQLSSCVQKLLNSIIIKPNFCEKYHLKAWDLRQ